MTKASGFPEYVANKTRTFQMLLRKRFYLQSLNFSWREVIQDHSYLALTFYSNFSWTANQLDGLAQNAFWCRLNQGTERSWSIFW